MIQLRNGYSQYCFALDSTFFEVKLTSLRPGRGQMLEAEAKAKILASRPVWLIIWDWDQVIRF